MKTSILILSFFLTPLLKVHTTHAIKYGKIDDGRYTATVRYINYNTGTNSTYTLIVKVEDDRVIMIDFGNGGSVHTGYNNENYIYSGGYLDFETNYDGNIAAATTTVTISESDELFYYKIRIE